MYHLLHLGWELLLGVLCTAVLPQTFPQKVVSLLFLFSQIVFYLVLNRIPFSLSQVLVQLKCFTFSLVLVRVNLICRLILRLN